MAFIVLDDTDTRQGGCTTHTAFRLAEAITATGGPLARWGLIAPPRLVRLNPAAPYRTRGNGALVLPVGPVPAGNLVRIGTWTTGGPILVPQTAQHVHTPLAPDVVVALRAVCTEVLPDAAPEGDPQPAALVLEEAPDPAAYHAAVSRLLAPGEAWTLAAAHAHRLTPPGRRGETGALAAAAWQPHEERRWSWEFIAYRDARETARGRTIDASLMTTILSLPAGFDNHDGATGRLRAVPRTPCPVQFAARGLDPHALVERLDPFAGVHGGWLLMTNQATGDHARYAGDRRMAHSIVRTPFEACARGARVRGGHVFLDGATSRGPLRLVAFEPTKHLRRVLAAAWPGDRFDVLGRTPQDTSVLHVEAICATRLAPRREQGPNPRCDGCSRAMKSRGHGSGFRCRTCGARAAESERTQREVPAGLTVGVLHQVPDHVRGHLLPPVAGLGAAGALDPSAAPSLPCPPALTPEGEGPTVAPLGAAATA